MFPIEALRRRSAAVRTRGAVGFGSRHYDLVILFETADRLETFIEEDGTAGAVAKAVAGSDAAIAGSGFIERAIACTLGEKNLMALAAVFGTPFWVDDKLDEPRSGGRYP